MSELAALAVFSLVSAGTPGPNNVILWASGIQFGVRPSMPHVWGTAVGIGTMAIAVAAGLGILVTRVPQVEMALKVAGSVYLIYLTYKVAGIRAVQTSAVARPLRWGQAAAFQYVNPKVWVFVLTAFSAFRPSEMSGLPAGILMVLVMVTVVFPCALLWAVGGSVLGRFVTSPRASRVVSAVLAVLVAGTVLYIWT